MNSSEGLLIIDWHFCGHKLAHLAFVAGVFYTKTACCATLTPGRKMEFFACGLRSALEGVNEESARATMTANLNSEGFLRLNTLCKSLVIVSE